MRHLLFISFFLLSIASCNINNTQSITKIKEISIFPDSTYLSESNNFLKNTCIKNINNEITAYWINYINHSFNIYNVTTKEYVNIKLDTSVFNNTIKHIDYQIINNNDIVFYFWRNKKLIVLNRISKKMRKYDLNNVLKQTDKYIVPLSAKQFPFIYNKNKISLIATYSNIKLDDDNYIKKYFSRNNTISLTLSDSFECTYYTSSVFPNNYKHNFYYSYYYNNCMNNKNQTVYSYSKNDSLFVYNEKGEFVNRYNAKSKYSNKFIPVKLSEINNMKYIREYELSNAFYEKIVYDKYKNRYYRFYKKECSYLNDKGKIRSSKEIPWSLIVLNAKFEKIGEIDFDPAKYSGAYIIPAKEGVYISCTLKNKKISLALVKFNL